MVDPGCTAVLKIRRNDGTRVQIDLPLIKSIETDVNVSLTEISTMVFGYRNNFCMDMGTMQKFTLKVERVNPSPYNDYSSDPAKWSNGKWYRWLEDQLDFWQNFGKDYNTGESSGGFLLELSSPDSSLFPSFRKNVFLSGSLNMTYSGLQMITVTLPLQVARMTGTTAAVASVTLTLVTEDIVDGGTKTAYATVSKDFEVSVPSLPSGWDQYQPGKVFKGWRGSSGTMYPYGTSHTWSEPETLTAVWTGAAIVKAYTYATAYSGSAYGDLKYTVPSGVTRATVYAVGGGGGAGGGSRSPPVASIDAYNYGCGGGGGSGEAVISRDTVVQEGDVFEFALGVGGTGGEFRDGAGTNGGDGKPTRVLLNGSLLVEAMGGKGGRRFGDGGAGGQQYNAGGTIVETPGRSGDGAYASPNVSSNAGRGGSGYKGSTMIWHSTGGGGGGAASFRYRFATGSTWHPGPAAGNYYESKGGDGMSVLARDNIERYAADGTVGGGGGSGWVESHSDEAQMCAQVLGSGSIIDRQAGYGGMGAVIIVMYAED